MCKTLKVSRAGYYRWRDRPGSTPILRTLQRSLIMGKRSVYVEEKKVQNPGNGESGCVPLHRTLSQSTDTKAIGKA